MNINIFCNADEALVDVVLAILPLLADNATHVCVIIPNNESAYIGDWIQYVREILVNSSVEAPSIVTASDKSKIIAKSSHMFAFNTALGALVRYSVLQNGLPISAVVDLVEALHGPSPHLVLCSMVHPHTHIHIHTLKNMPIIHA